MGLSRVIVERATESTPFAWACQDRSLAKGWGGGHNPNMQPDARFPVLDHLPFYITAPGETDVLLVAVALTLVAVVIGFGALYFTIQAIPDRIAEGTSKAQMQLVGLLGLISLFTMNNLYWIAAILLAAVRIPDFVTPLKDIAASLRDREAEAGEAPLPEDPEDAVPAFESGEAAPPASEDESRDTARQEPGDD